MRVGARAFAGTVFCPEPRGGGAARSEAGKFVMDLAAPTHTYADRLREAFYQSSLLHPLLHPAPDCRAHLLRGDDRMVANLPRGFSPGRMA